MLRQVEHLLLRQTDVKPSDRIVVGFSGGADSTFLLHAMRTLGYSCIALHCNFNLRGEASDLDEIFVRTYCEEQAIPLEVTAFNTHQIARSRGISLEMAARELRYEWYETMRIKHNAQWIAVGHHSEDTQETILLNLMRGTGIRGLLGLKPVNGKIIRPLLTLTKTKIVQACAQVRINYRTDQTNFEPICQRNRIRGELLPLMESISPGAGARLLRMAHNLRLPAELLNLRIETIQDQWIEHKAYRSLDRKRLCESPHCEALLFELLHPYGFTATQINELIASFSVKESKQFISPSHQIYKETDFIHLQPLTYMTKPPKIISQLIVFDPQTTSIPTNAASVLIDLDEVEGELTLRLTLPGDRFQPIGMKGTKLISDFLKEQRLPTPERKDTWLLCDEDRIIWIVGHRLDHRYRIRDTTTAAMLLEVKE